MRRILTLTAVLTLAAATLSATVAGASTDKPTKTVAIGRFNDPQAVGTSKFTERNGTIRVVVNDTQAPKGLTIFTVLYGNTNCDPAQALPFLVGKVPASGVFTGVANGTDTVGNAVANVGSISQRRGDNQNDIDGDGKLGPTDVVAVAGHPNIGLLACDPTPVHR